MLRKERGRLEDTTHSFPSPVAAESTDSSSAVPSTGPPVVRLSPFLSLPSPSPLAPQPHSLPQPHAAADADWPALPPETNRQMESSMWYDGMCGMQLITSMTHEIM